MTGNYIGNNPNGLDIVLSDDYETNNSHLIASTACVYQSGTVRPLPSEGGSSIIIFQI